MPKKVTTKKISEEDKPQGSFFVGIIMIILGGLLILGVVLSGFGFFGAEISSIILQDAVMNLVYGIIFIVTAVGVINAEEWALGILAVTLFLIVVNTIVAIIDNTSTIPMYITIPIIITAVLLMIYLYKIRKKYD